MAEIAQQSEEILTEVLESGGAALGMSQPLREVAGEGGAEDVVGALESLGYYVPARLTPGNWRAVLAGLGLGGVVTAETSSAEAQAAILRLVALDGESPLDRMPAPGEVSVRSRVLHLRLKYLGLFPYPVAAPAGVHDVGWEEALRSWLGPALPASTLELANLLGDFPRLWQAYVPAMRDRPFLVLKGAVDESRPEEELERIAREWAPAEGYSGPELPRDAGQLEEEARNDFGLRLLRLTLWMDGLSEDYSANGERGGDAGLVMRALRVRGIVTSDASGRERSVIRRVGADTWAVRLDGMETAFVRLDRPRGGTDVPAPASAFTAFLLGSRGNEEDGVFLERIEAFATATRPPKPEPRAGNPILRFARRAYQGLKRTVEWAGRLIREGFSWLREHVAVPLTGYVRRAIGSVVRAWQRFKDEVVPRVLAFLRGLHLNVHPTSRTFALRHMCIDCDAAVFVSPAAHEDVLQSLREYMRNFSQVLRVTLRVAGRVFGLLWELACGPVGWAKAAFAIGGIVMEVLSAG